MGCSYARETDEWHGWECSVTEGACMFFHPNSALCAAEYGEGPNAAPDEGKEETLDQQMLKDVIIKIKHRRRIAYRMSNEDLADELLPLLKEEFPGIILIKCGRTQWFVISKAGKSFLKKRLLSRKKNCLQEVENIDAALRCLD